MLKRDPEGKFLESPDSLYRKTIGLRVSKSIYPKLEELAQKTGKSMAEIARDAVHEYIQRLEEEKKATKKTNKN
ncbi:ribbon-helix-helix domain-containing protein [Crocosphaera sp.]|uniref:ribbon-helix-helix domain-containing protein n=1 Tax=Crocosphaera sp. TaxID=2729996 RepID=UPI002602483C|nr:ribbon-helix-helix domain-containing protein [Crocosphaera sp.]MDJ0581672.1 ribbon-helix-helix domain-containing protein [Crocosphaera sp.]